MRRYFDYLVRWHGSGDILPVYLEGNVYNFYMQKEVATIEQAKPAMKIGEQTPVERSSSSGNGSGRARARESNKPGGERRRGPGSGRRCGTRRR